MNDKKVMKCQNLLDYMIVDRFVKPQKILCITTTTDYNDNNSSVLSLTKVLKNLRNHERPHYIFKQKKNSNNCVDISNFHKEHILVDKKNEFHMEPIYDLNVFFYDVKHCVSQQQEQVNLINPTVFVKNCKLKYHYNTNQKLKSTATLPTQSIYLHDTLNPLRFKHIYLMDCRVITPFMIYIRIFYTSHIKYIFRNHVPVYINSDIFHTMTSHKARTRALMLKKNIEKVLKLCNNIIVNKKTLRNLKLIRSRMDKNKYYVDYEILSHIDRKRLQFNRLLILCKKNKCMTISPLSTFLLSIRNYITE